MLTPLVGEHFSVGLVQWPLPGDRFRDTGEGGVEVWLLIPSEPRGREGRPSVRDVCITGFSPGLVGYDCIVSDWLSEAVLGARAKAESYRQKDTSLLLECAVCIGASSASYYDEARGGYWQPSFDDLTPEGKALFVTLANLYDREPLIGVALDT